MKKLSDEKRRVRIQFYTNSISVDCSVEPEIPEDQ